MGGAPPPTHPESRPLPRPPKVANLLPTYYQPSYLFTYMFHFICDLIKIHIRDLVEPAPIHDICN